MDAPAHPKIALKVIPAPGLGQGAGKSAACGEGMLLHFAQSEEWIQQEVFPVFQHCL
jgi:hypothetical protein